MRRRMVIILVLALVSGGLAAYLAYRVLSGTEEEGEQERTVQVTEVAVAATPMDVGDIVAAENVKMVEWPADAVPADYSQSASEVVGRGVITPVAVNEPLLASKLARKEAGGGLSIVVPEGMRAMSVPVNQVVGVAGFVLPGTRVDVIVTATPPGGGEFETQVVLQDVEVLSAGQLIRRTTEGQTQPQVVSVVTVLVTPEQAETLTLATESGQLQLALRNTLDRDTTATAGIEASRVLPRWRVTRGAPVSTGPRRPSSRVQVEIYRGPQRSSTTVDTSMGGGR